MRPYISLILALFILLPALASAQPYLSENQTWQENLTAIYYSSLALGDIDNNGYLDLLTIGKSENGISTKIYTNNGSTFQENITWEDNLTNVHYGAVAFGDIDNDGDLDLVLTGCSSGGGYVNNCNDGGFQSLVYVNNGSSLVENSTWQINLEKIWRGSIALGDIDNDGDLDLALTGQTSTGRVSKIYLNNKTSFIEDSYWGINLKPLDSSAVVFADIDKDGDLDIILSGESSSSPSHTTRVYTNNGSIFNENATWQQNLEIVRDSSIAVGDIDNDGDLDLSLIGCCDVHRTYNNTGSAFEEIQGEITHFVGVFAGSQAFGDYDNDGDLDMITTGREGYTPLYANSGNGIFTDYWGRPEKQIAPLEYSSLVWNDIDNDLDLDLILTGWGDPGDWYQKRIYTNNITTKNTYPSASNDNFNNSFNFSTGELTLSWGNGSDTETPTLGLYYNLRIGICSGCHDIVTGVFGGGDDNGYFGNMMQRKSITLNRPELENKTIYWAVQTIDTGLAKSEWSEEQVFEIVQSPPPRVESWTYGEWGECVNGQQTRSATDLNECGTIENRSSVTRSCTSDTSGPGGPSGPIITPPEEKKKPENATEYFERILAGVDTGVSVDESGLAVQQVWVKVRNEVREVSVFINKLDSKPTLVTKEPEEKVYQYLNITYTNLQDGEIETGKIYFKVEKEWLEQNSINKSTIRLLRYRDNEWHKLKTEIREEDSEYVRYQTETPGFSIFAIAGKVLEEAGMVCVPMERKCENEKLLECSVDGIAWMLEEVCEYGCENDKCRELYEWSSSFVFIWLGIPLILILVGFYFLIIRKAGF